MTTKEVLATLKTEDVYELLVKKGLTDDFETFKKEAENFTGLMTSGKELTDAQLEMVAGGGKWDEPRCAV